MRPQGRAFDRLPAGRTGHRGGVNQAQLVGPARRVRGQVLEGEGDQRPRPTQALVVGRRGRQIGEQVAKAAVGEPQPTPLAVPPEQHLGDGQADQFGVAQLGAAPRPHPWAEQLIDHDIECDDEGVEVGVHEASQEVDVAFATPTLGALVSPVTAHHPQADSEAII
jgi:hypothetical protein